MKFPNVLSKERLSLLSQEDRAIYESEHKEKSELDALFESTMFGVDVEPDSKISKLIDEEFDYSDIITEEIDNFCLELFSPKYNTDDYKKDLKFYFNDKTQLTDNHSSYITEGAEGLDHMAWVRGLKLGWMGTVAGAGLGALGTGLAYLITLGKDHLAMEKLKRYMNKLVEIVDQGIHKKRPWYSFVLPTRKQRQHTGEYNMGCFRTVQETADRNMTNSVMSVAHKLGFFSQGSMMDISNASTPQYGSGLDAFRQNVISQLNVVVNHVD